MFGWEAVVACDEAMSIEDINGSNGISVYPNPATSVLNIDSKAQIQSIKLTDASGKLIIHNKSKEFNKQVQIEHLPKGVYILTVELENETITKKIVKK